MLSGGFACGRFLILSMSSEEDFEDVFFGTPSKMEVELRDERRVTLVSLKENTNRQQKEEERERERKKEKKKKFKLF